MFKQDREAREFAQEAEEAKRKGAVASPYML